MYCGKCGKRLNDEEIFCTECGKQQTINSNGNNDVFVSINADIGNAGYYFLGAFVPLLALILGIVWRTEKPISSKQIIIGGIIFLLEIVFIVLSIAFNNKFVTILLLGMSVYLVYFMIRNVNKYKKDYIAKLAMTSNSNNQIYPTVNLKERRQIEKRLTLAIVFLILSVVIVFFILLLPHIMRIVIVVGLVIMTVGLILLKEDFVTDLWQNFWPDYYFSPLFIVGMVIALIFLGLAINNVIKYSKKMKQLFHKE